MIVIFVSGLTLLIAVLASYKYICTLRVSQEDRRRLQEGGLQLSHVLRLLDDPDVKFLMEDSSACKDIFAGFSESIRQDVEGFSSRLTQALFLAAYYLLQVKTRVRCGRKDLRFLANLELLLWRACR